MRAIPTPHPHCSQGTPSFSGRWAAAGSTEYPDVVTEADLNGERAMRALIEARYPDHGILGEEFGSTRLDADWVWVLDPVDGTRDFATGTMTWGSLIGLCFRSQPVLGVIDQPVAGERWIGAHGHLLQFEAIGEHHDSHGDPILSTPPVNKENCSIGATLGGCGGGTGNIRT